MKIGDIVYIKTSFGHGFGRYKGVTAKIIGRNPYHKKVWNILILEGAPIKINNVNEKDLQLVWSVS